MEIQYDEATELSFYSSTHGGAINSAYRLLRIGSAAQTLTVKTRSFNVFHSAKALPNSFEQIYSLAIELIGFRIVDKLVQQVKNGATVRIGRLSFNLKGISARRLFWSRHLGWNSFPHVRQRNVTFLGISAICGLIKIFLSRRTQREGYYVCNA